MTTEILWAIAIVAVAVLALYATKKGRGFWFGVQRGENKVEIGIAGKKNESSTSSVGSDNIEDVSVLDHGKVERSNNVNIHVGHNTVKQKD